jgi:hypothetical protein
VKPATKIGLFGAITGTAAFGAIKLYQAYLTGQLLDWVSRLHGVRLTDQTDAYLARRVSWSTLSEDTLFELQNSGVLTYLAAQPPVRELFEQLAATHPPFISPTARSVFQRALNASSRTSMQSAQRP